MKNAPSHQSDERADMGNYPDASRNNYSSGREQHAGARGEFPTSERPSYGTQNEQLRRGYQDRYAPRDEFASENESSGKVFRFGRAAQFPRHQFEDYGDGQRVNHFGYPEIERHGPYGQEFSGAGMHLPHRPYFYANDIGDPGAYWQNQSFLNQPYPEGRGYASEYYPHNYERPLGSRIDAQRGGYSGWDQTEGRGQQHTHPRHSDPDYHQWRNEQIQKFDRDYDDWRQERYTKFSDDFNNWRSTRLSGEGRDAGDSSPSGGQGATAKSSTQHGGHATPDKK